MRTNSLFSVTTIGLTVIWLSGCSPATNTNSTSNSTTSNQSHDSHEGHDHGHEGHAHSHAEVGPNGGHLLELGNEEFHVEWAHDDESGKLTAFILDGAAKELVPISAEKLTIEKTIGERTDKYDLVAVDRQGETPKSAKFEIVDKALVAALKMVGDGVEASITVDVNGQPFTAKFTKHEDHHGHKH